MKYHYFNNLFVLHGSIATEGPGATKLLSLCPGVEMIAPNKLKILAVRKFIVVHSVKPVTTISSISSSDSELLGPANSINPIFFMAQICDSYLAIGLPSLSEQIKSHVLKSLSLVQSTSTGVPSLEHAYE